VTDCLGHVALLTELFAQLAEHRPALGPTVVGVFIANEENATLCGIGARCFCSLGVVALHVCMLQLVWVGLCECVVLARCMLCMANAKETRTHTPNTHA
jgi:hypothetical protein